MKKLFVMLLVVSMVMAFSIVAAAGTYSSWIVDQGLFANYSASKFLSLHESTRASGAQYVVVEGMTTSGTIRQNWGPQDASITVRADAYIPCYLELELIGNRGYTKIKQIGPGVDGTIYHGSNSVFMLFHPELTGMVNEDWEFINIAASPFSTIGPNREGRDAVYIHACDMFRANLYGNVPYGFSVSALPFTGPGTGTFEMDMRYTLDESTWAEATIGAEEVGQFGALEENTVFMQFRVPFAEVQAGKYTSTVTFKVYTL